MPAINDTAALSRDEFDLLLLTARAAPGGAAEQRAMRLIQRGIRWDRVLHVASLHAIDALAGANWLKLPGAGLPEELAVDVQRRLRQTTMHGIFLSAQLANILRAFATANIRTISFKGPTLAMQAYHTLSARPFGDVDVLVSPADACRAAKVLNGIGFAGWGIQPQHEALHLRSECEETFTRESGAGRVTVDLHWALSRGYLPLAIEFNELWQRSITIPVASMPMWTLGCEDLLLYLCLHGAKHAWERLIWVCDIAELLHQERRIDWEALFARAGQTGTGRCLRLGLLLARDLLDATLPAEIDERVRQDPVVVVMAQSLSRELAAGKGNATSGLPAQLRSCLFHLRLRDGLFDRARYLWLAALPNTRDRGAFPLPRPLFFLHYLSRPLRLLGRHRLWRTS